MKKALTIVLALVLALSLSVTAMAELTAKGGTDHPVADHTWYSQFPLVKEGEDVTITVAHIRNASYGLDADKQWIWAWSEYATGLNFEVQQIVNTNKDELVNLMFASDEVPDLVFQLGLTTSQITKYGMIEHQLKDLKDWITPERMPYLSRWFEAFPDSKTACTTPDGAIYVLPGYNNIFRAIGNQPQTFINMEVLKDCGLENPKTLDDFIAAMYAIKEKYPDFTPIVGSTVDGANNSLHFLLNAFGYVNNDGFGHDIAVRNGQAVIPCGDPTFVEYLKLLNKFYNDGIINKDFFTAEKLTVDSYLTEHKAAVYGAMTYAVLPEVEEFQKWESVFALTSEWNDTPAWKDTNCYKVGNCAIGAKITDEKLDLLLRYLDFFYTDLGAAYLWDGPVAGSADCIGMVDGWYYNFDTDVRTFVQVESGEYETGTAYVQGPIGTCGTGWGNRSHSIDYPETLTYFYEIAQYLDGANLENVKPYAWTPDHGDGWGRLSMKANLGDSFVTGFPDIVYFDEETQETVDEITVLLEKFVESEFAKFVTGARDLSEFDAFVSECEAYGLRDLEKIYQDAYASYLANAAQ